MTGRALAVVDDKSTGYALGAVDYVTKPVDRERLLAILNAHLRTPGEMGRRARKPQVNAGERR